MKNKKIVFGIVILLFVITGIYNISYAFTDELYLSSSSYGGYNLGYLSNGDIIKINEIDSSGTINVYIMNDEQYSILVSSGGLTWTYLMRWKDVTYLSGLTFDITTNNDYYIILYNKNVLFSRTIQVDVSIEYKSITIISPINTDTFLSGYNYIAWISTGNIDYVKIDLYRNGVYLETLSLQTINNGGYSWYIYDDEYIDGSNYQIRILDYNDNSIYDYSEYFTIESEVVIMPGQTMTNMMLSIMSLLIPIIIIVLVITIAGVLIYRRRKRIREDFIPITREIPVKEEPVKSQERELPRITYCSSCGAEILDKTGDFCSKCGAPFK